MKLKVFVLLMLFSCVSVFAQSQNDEQLKSLVNKMIEAQTNFKPEVLDTILAADYIEISPVGEFDPREKVLGFYKPELKPPADKSTVKVEADEFSIRQYNGFAVVITRLNYTITSEGKPLSPYSLRATVVCRQEKDGWKIVSAQYTGIRPPRPAPKS